MNLILGVLLYLIGQILIWVQVNGQFVWPIVKEHPITVSIVFGTGISYLFIIATKFTVEYYEGLLWPSRFISFAVGIVVFAVMTWWFLSEGLDAKTVVSLLLATALLAVQVLWK